MNGPNTSSAAQVASEPAEGLLQALAQYDVVIDCPDHIRTYLQRHTELIPHVLTAVEQTRQEFGEAAELTLTINDDPESYDPYLKMYVSLPNYGPDTMPRIDRIQEPLDEATAGLEGYFLVTTDHRLVGG
jgi:hypothetical protein